MSEVKENVIGTTGLQSDAQQYLKDLFDRVERLDHDRKVVCEEIKENWDDAKDKGYDLAILKRIFKDRKKKKDKLLTEHQIYDVYAHAIGMLSDEDK